MELEVRFIPRIIGFLGYAHFVCPEDTLGKLAWFKKVNGVSYERLGILMGRDPEQLEDWLGGRHKACRQNREEVERFLAASG